MKMEVSKYVEIKITQYQFRGCDERLAKFTGMEFPLSITHTKHHMIDSVDGGLIYYFVTTSRIQ